MAGGSKYRLGERIGGGGMAEVYRATLVGAEGFARQVAIKRMLPSLSADPTFAEMFVNEARLASLLGHPNIVSTLDFDRDAEQRLFLVMELVDGCDLKQLLATGRPPVAVSAFIIAEVLRGLGFAHDLEQNGRPLTIVHRDVSPHNVLLSWGGAVKLSDFGIAKAVAASSASRTGSLKGKVGYMSPEQAHGLTLDGRSDLFAVGVMFHELLMGRRLFGGQTEAEVLSRMLAQPISSPRAAFDDISEDVEFVCMRLLERDRDQRFASAQAALEALLGCDVMSVRGQLELKQLMRERFPRQSGTDGGAAAAAMTPAVGSANATAAHGRRAIERGELMDAPTRTRGPRDGDLPGGVTASATPTAAGEQRPAPLSGPFPGRSTATAAAVTAAAARGQRSKALALGAAVALLLAIAYFAFFTGAGRDPGGAGSADDPALARVAPGAGGPATAGAVAPSEAAAPASDASPIATDGRPGLAGTDAVPAADDPGEPSAAVEPTPADPELDEREKDDPAAARRRDRRRRARERKEQKAKEQAARDAAAKEQAARDAAAKEQAERERKKREASKEPGKLRITVRPWALVSIDGGDERQTPLPTVTLPPGRHRVRLRNDELDKTETRTVTIRSGKTQTINLDWR